MNKIISLLRRTKSQKSFKSEFEKFTQELVKICFEYVKFDSIRVKTIYILCVIDEGLFIFNTFYNINGEILEKHKLGDKFDTSIRMQSRLNEEANKICRQLIDTFTNYDKDSPTSIKITYTLPEGKFDCRLTYEPVWTQKPYNDPHMICDAWIEEEESKLVT